LEAAPPAQVRSILRSVRVNAGDAPSDDDLPDTDTRSRQILLVEQGKSHEQVKADVKHGSNTYHYRSLGGLTSFFDYFVLRAPRPGPQLQLSQPHARLATVASAPQLSSHMCRCGRTGRGAGRVACIQNTIAPPGMPPPNYTSTCQATTLNLCAASPNARVARHGSGAIHCSSQ
jgi:hypothetical protein